MIIVEGADNVGKTTLVTQLIQMDPSIRLLKRDKFVKDRGENIATSYIKSLLPVDGDWRGHLNSVADRMLASECIYGDLFRDGCRMSEAEHITILNILKAFKALIVFCDPPDWAVEQSWKKRDQMYHDHKRICKAYRDRIIKIFDPEGKGELPIFRYDYTAVTPVGARTQREDILRIHRKRMVEVNV